MGTHYLLSRMDSYFYSRILLSCDRTVHCLGIQICGSPTRDPDFTARYHICSSSRILYLSRSVECIHDNWRDTYLHRYLSPLPQTKKKGEPVMFIVKGSGIAAGMIHRLNTPLYCNIFHTLFHRYSP